MKRFLFALALLFVGLTSAGTAQARAFVSVGLGGGYYGGYGHYYGGSPYYGYPGYYAYPTYYAPPSVVYAQPQQTVIYAQQPAPQTTYVTQQPVTATQAQPSYTDAQGRTCRQFQSTVDGAPLNGTACLQQDGTWRTVE